MLAVAVALCATVRAADLHDVDLEGYVTPPGSLSRLEPRPAAVLPLAPTGSRSPSGVQAAGDPPAALPPSLSLVWIDGRATAAGSERPARDEALRLLRLMGVEASWRTGRAGETAQPGELRVILLDRAAVDLSGSPVLGSTPSRFEGERFFWVHVPSARAALGLDPGRAPGPSDLRDRYLLGVALGRVIAHETVHAVAPGVPHGVGLMAPLLKKNDLTAKTVAVPAELGRAIQAALAGGDDPLRTAAAGTVAAPLLTVGAERVDLPR